MMLNAATGAVMHLRLEQELFDVLARIEAGRFLVLETLEQIATLLHKTKRNEQKHF